MKKTIALSVITSSLVLFVPMAKMESDTATSNITIIKVQSYPSVGGNWTVRFNTTGTADLTIKALDGTEFGGDIEFLELGCGDKVLAAELTDGAVFVENYSCDETGCGISGVLIAGRHALEFWFGDDVEFLGEGK